MRWKISLFAILLMVTVSFGTLSAQAKELRFAFQGTLNSFDPYNLNETFHLGTKANVYEGLIPPGPDMRIQPALAARWASAT